MRKQILSSMRRALFATIAAISPLSAAPVHAQSFQVGIDFTAVVPRGEFKENIENNGYGLSGNFLVALGPSPFLVGVDAGFATYGSEKRRVPLSSSIPDITVDVTTDNNIVLTHFVLRAQPRSGPVRPYVDGLVGFKYLFTQTKVEADSAEDPLASTTNLSDFAFSYGVGGGVQFRLAGLGGGRELQLDTNVRHLWGSEARYLREGSIQRDDGDVIFDVLTSRTNVVTVQVGVSFRF
jgi:hypothetical protein